MENLTFKDIKNLGFKIEEDIQHVSQFFEVDLNDSETSITDFSPSLISSELIESNYELSKTTYSISKGSSLLLTALSVEEIIEFFTSGEYKNY